MNILTACRAGSANVSMIAIAIAGDPKILIADEPTTALDVTVQAQIIRATPQSAHELSVSVILISHDLGLVSEFADRAMVMYAGQPVETGPIDKIFDEPLHPYTEGLLSAIPDLDDDPETGFANHSGFHPRTVASPAWMPLRPALHLRTGKLRQTPTHNEPDGWAGQPLSAAAAHRGVCPMSDVMTANRRSFLAEDGKETIVRTDDLVRDFDLRHRPGRWPTGWFYGR